ncbi:ATP-binding cassette glutathione S-conjugate transporter YCF1 NDAI_0J01150 [Naumovozyma dairenensis CBS 421]|uniref:Uncharacterized protein n=1 Tax=Naumovozyma dairenensis (strain ATCC 10597 / BCRC 20456 / CBS 421 / NBRC 0211 / NRRL Y-12639) TaxID=1071378 RepID=G0WGS9_NAUDC|nr:hypothetical protein NDAI_0J01150 [Naumovozyma dairenensis CBS 421]CCD27007.1 hypothetical protein NDAI_0J01150 [Naumovozyma dairenensis CBS 421]
MASDLSSWICKACNSSEGFGPVSFYGDLTQCFIDGVILNLSALFMLIFGTRSLIKLCTMKTPTVKYRRNWIIVSRIILVLLQICFTALACLKLPHDKSRDFTVMSQYTLTLLSLFVVICLHWIEYHRSQVANSIVLFYWLFEAVGNGSKTFNFIVRHTYEHRWTFGHIVFILTLFQTIIAIAVLLLEALPKKPLMPYQEIQEHLSRRKANPYDTANIFSKITFSWMSELMQTGYEKYLVETDLYKLPESFNSAELSEKFENNWQNQIKHKANPSLAWALVITFGGKMVLASFLKIIHDCMAFIQPQLLRILIKFVTEYNEEHGISESLGLDTLMKHTKLPIIRGFMIAISMFMVGFIQTSVLHQYFLNCFDTGMHIKSALTSVIYEKALVLSNEASGISSTGDIVNLMSVDVQKLQDISQFINLLWSAPFQIVLCLISLYKLLGHSMWVGVIILVIMMPLNSFLMKTQKKLQKSQMQFKDERTRVISEILNNIKSLKLYAWETPYKAKLENVRNNKELKNLTKLGCYMALMSFQFNVVPFLVSCSTFAVFVYTEDRPLTTDLVFPALTLFNLLHFPLMVIPNVLTALIECSVSVGRLFSFLTNEELQKDSVQRLPKVTEIGDVAINVGDDATFLWQRKPEYKVALKNVNFQAKKGELTCIVGRVGSGKSALIQSILGDLFRVKGFATIHGNVAYVSQVAWIMNGTVKDNILFGHKYDAEFYEKTIKACALTIDLSVLVDGDQTLVGEKGISLSGGQKARLSLARAVYSRADTYLLDDPLAAVDEHVARHLIEHVLGPNGLLHTKTKVLATNKVSVLSVADSVSLLENGEIVQQGSYDEIMKDGASQLNKLIMEYGKKSNGNPASSNAITPASSSTNIREQTIPLEDELKELKKLEDINLVGNEVQSLRRASDATLRSIDFGEDEGDVRREHREQGKVKWNIYLEYAKACNPRNVAIFMIFAILSMFLSVMGSVWLKHWSEINTKYGSNPHAPRYLLIYLLLGITSALFTLIQTVILWVFCTIQGSRYLHTLMTNAVLRAPMSFFETTPIGRILNRFSNDIYKVDSVLGRTFSQFFVNAVKVSFTIGVICVTTWQFIFVIVPLGVFYIYYQQYYLRTSRELRRLDSITRSPVYSHFQETLGGIVTIRGYGQQKRFSQINQCRVDNNMSAFYPSVNANRWLAYRLELIGSIIILGAATLSVMRLKQGTLTAGMVGLSLSYALQITQSLNWIVRMTVEVETNIVSVERIKEYADLKSEAPEIIEDHRPQETWPEEGDIKFEHYSTRYRPELDLVLKDINFHIKPKEKIGIVGRTGAGKSSLTLALFRIIEASEGNIIIDNVDISDIGLYDLRHKLSIIPQDSQVFEGTIRENIDPTNQYTDEQIWRVLELSHLRDHIATMGGDGLDTKLNEGGSNLSVGQRQLMCLARALLVPSKILVLDEATAAVDVETDKVLQETIRTSFKDRTILTIAHRINTIMDNDRIMVLDNGSIKEFDEPKKLLENKSSLFYSLCEEAGLTTK